MTAKWTKDPIVESKLKTLGVAWNYVDSVPLKDIDIMGSRRNNARLTQQFNEELAIEYAIALNDGDVFPATILRPLGGQFKYFVVSGNHRIGAAQVMEEKDIAAYVLETDDDMVCDILTRAANRWMGDRQSKDEAVEHARALIAKYHRTNEEMAKLFGLKPVWLSQALRAEDARDGLEKLQVNSREMPRSTILILSTLQDNERVFRKAGYLASRFSIPQTRVKELVAAVKSQKNETDQIAALKMLEDQLKEERNVSLSPASPVHNRPNRTRLLQYINTLSNFLTMGNDGKPFNSLNEIGITSVHDRHELREKFRDIRVKVEELLRVADKDYENRKRK